VFQKNAKELPTPDLYAGSFQKYVLHKEGGKEESGNLAIECHSGGVRVQFNTNCYGGKGIHQFSF